MDQQSIETLLRRLVARVEESERRYSEALDELHARLDQLSQTTAAAQKTGAAEDSEAFGLLHDQVSDLARRLEREAASPLDDFERLGRALAGDLDYGLTAPSFPAFPAPPQPEPAFTETTPFGLPPREDFSFPPLTPPESEQDRDLDKRLVEMAHRLEHSVGMAMPAQALDALNARLDEISHQIAHALVEPKRGASLEPVQQQISDLAQAIDRVEAKLVKIGEIETALHGLIERVDAAPERIEEIADKAASEAARRVADQAKLGTATAERLDAMHRDLMAMGEATRASDERLAGTIEAVHASLKELVQQLERSGPEQPMPKPRAPFAERMRDLAPISGMAAAQPSVEMPLEKRGIPKPAGEQAPSAPRNRLAAAIADLEDAETMPAFGRKHSAAEERPVDLDEPAPRRLTARIEEDADYETPDDLVAAARRAAQAAAAKAEERASSAARIRRAPPERETPVIGELPARRKRSLLIVFAAVLLGISALLLYSRLRSKPEPELTPPATEQNAPAPSAPSDSGQPPATEGENAPAEPVPATPATPSSSEVQPDWSTETVPAENAAGDSGELRNFTDVAKSSYRPATSDGTMPRPQPASLKPEGPALPPGVVLSVEDPSLGAQSAAPIGTPVPSSMPVSLPLPPAELGPLPLREAAAQGDARAQYLIALRYAQGEGVTQDLTEAGRWLERAASGGLASAQYRLGAMYERGQGVARDLGRARSWYQAAAEKGNVKAMHNLAVSLSARDGGAADYGLAAKWYGEAAAYGLADSQYNLGILAEHGLGIAKDLKAAYKWFALAAKSGDAESAKRRDEVKQSLDAASLAAADSEIGAWAAKQANPDANDVVEPQEWADLSPATTTALVSRAQTLLNKLGYDVGEPDGMMGARTREAIKSFERKNGLEETGTVSILLVTKLERLTS
jgi:localization factor PodJL